MESTLVIKVKYGDTLRRFNARLDENNRLDLDVAGLRARILSLFNIPPDVNFILRYVDEDGDLVTLVDDDDLHDVMRQDLKFLRIDVHVNHEPSSKSNARSSGSSTPLRSPRVPNPSLSGNAAVADALKSVPEPIREALSKLSLDLGSKAASSGSVLGALADCISIMGQSLLNARSQPTVAAGSSPECGGLTSLFAPSARSQQPIAVESTSNVSQDVEAGNVTRGVAAPVTPVDLNTLPCEPNPSQSTTVNAASVSSAVPDCDGRKGKAPTDDSFSGKGVTCGGSTSNAAPDNSSTQTKVMGFSPVECPFSGSYFTDSAQPSLRSLRIHPFKRSHSHTEATGGMFHKGVRCDGCGIYPITGPRFKSKVKENYDLCSICFNEMGNETDYIRMDRPGLFRDPPTFKNVNGYGQVQAWMPSLPVPCAMRTAMKHVRPKLDSRFILDVNVIDGTMMAPSTAFTKIWRMRNNGNVVWPRGTQLVWIGGDKFSEIHAVDLEIPVDGVPVEKELDVAVDFIAPQSPGRYISYWRMATATGQKFGQRVWVLIQVDASLKESFYNSSQGLNLNVPLDDSDSRGPEIIDINVQPAVDDLFSRSRNSDASTEPAKQIVNEQPSQELENNLLTNETTFIGNGASAPPTSEAPSSVSYPIIDLSETVLPVPTNPQNLAVGELSSAGINGNNRVEETLLKELEEMGFKQVDLNKEVLRMNEYNLEQSVDDLCGVSEWDPILEELQEMGFCDNEMNKRLLKKNNGSIKRVVMDLINGEVA